MMQPPKRLTIHQAQARDSADRRRDGANSHNPARRNLLHVGWRVLAIDLRETNGTADRPSNTTDCRSGAEVSLAEFAEPDHRRRRVVAPLNWEGRRPMTASCLPHAVSAVSGIGSGAVMCTSVSGSAKV